MRAVIRSVELPNGVRLPYAEQGDDRGIPVVLLHGVTDSWRSFEPVLPHLPGAIRALALTQRGHGDADRPEHYRFEDFAADVVAFLDALGIEAAVVVGHSMGSYVAQRFAMDHPDRTLALVLAGSFTTMRDNPVVLDLWQSTVSKLTDPIDPAFVREFQESTIARPVPPALLDTVVQESLAVPARVWRAAFQAHIESDFSSRLGEISAPTLILWGDRDAICPRSEQDALAAQIAGARLVVWSGAGHALHWEEPGRFATELVAFIEDCVD